MTSAVDTLSVPAPAHDGASWWRQAVVYQVYPRSFADENGDGIGDIAGITSRVPYLAELGIDDLSVQPVVWYWVFLVCALVAVVAAGAAVRLAPAWPEMGSRYDAPGAAPQPREETGLDLWKALDQGRDPTLTDRRPPAGE